MRCPTLKELPPPPEGKTGWPWTEESPQLPDTMPDGKPWPKISIVTPNYNYGQFIEETIRSVLLQGYPNLEYIIIDGASTDNSVEIIKKYEKWLAYWVSEPDNGQTQAINKGFRRATGDITTWLNIGDIFLPEAFGSVAKEFFHVKDTSIVVGDAEMIRGERRYIQKRPKVNYKTLIMIWEIRDFMPPQPAVFFKRKLLDECGLLDERLQFAMDYDLWLRFSLKHKFNYLDKLLVAIRILPGTKMAVNLNNGFVHEWGQVSRRYWRKKSFLMYWYFKLSFFKYCMKIKSRQLYEKAENEYCSSRIKGLMYILCSIGYFPPGVFNRNKISIIGRIVLGESIFKKIKKFFIKSNIT